MHESGGIPQLVTAVTDPCDIIRRWKVTPEVAARAVLLVRSIPFEASIISGYRTPARQEELRRQGRPAADPNVSNHTRCPATALDWRISVTPTDSAKAEFGRAAVAAGFRWGGGSPVDPNTGIPSDWNHVDLGPRRQ